MACHACLLVACTLLTVAVPSSSGPRRPRTQDITTDDLFTNDMFATMMSNNFKELQTVRAWLGWMWLVVSACGRGGSRGGGVCRPRNVCRHVAPAPGHTRPAQAYENFYQGLASSWQSEPYMTNASLAGGAGLGFGVQVSCGSQTMLSIGGGCGSGFSGSANNMTAGGGGGAGIQGTLTVAAPPVWVWQPLGSRVLRRGWFGMPVLRCWPSLRPRWQRNVQLWRR